MKKALCIFAAAAMMISCAPKETPLSARMAASEMTRCGDGAHLDFMEGRLKWNYTTGLELKAMLDVYDTYGGDSLLTFVDAWYDAIIDSTGAIATYSVEKFNTDHVCPARTLFRLEELTGREKYTKAIELVRSQLDAHPRTSQGGFWHKKVYPCQMWLDGLYMAQPFYAQYTAQRESDPERRDSLFRDICNHFLVVAEHTYDPQTRLYRHAWDESREMFWADMVSGQSAHAWGRALGWYCMAIVDVLDWVPEGTEGREEMIRIFRDLYEVALPAVADPQTGMWYQVLDCPGREGNYLEATGSAMFVYAMLKGVRTGILDSGMLEQAKDKYASLVETFISEEDGLLSIDSCCAVAGLGGKEMRSGDYDYYIHEAVRSNDAKGVGPFIWASLEMERL